MVKPAWLMRETQYLMVSIVHRSNPRPSRIFANSRLISIFYLFTIELLYVVFSLVFAKQSFASVLKLSAPYSSS